MSAIGQPNLRRNWRQTGAGRTERHEDSRWFYDNKASRGFSTTARFRAVLMLCAGGSILHSWQSKEGRDWSDSSRIHSDSHHHRCPISYRPQCVTGHIRDCVPGSTAGRSRDQPSGCAWSPSSVPQRFHHPWASPISADHLLQLRRSYRNANQHFLHLRIPQWHVVHRPHLLLLVRGWKERR